MKKWSSFLLCLLLSTAIWLTYNLSQSHTDIVSVEVVAESNIEGRAERSSDAVIMAARCTASGFRLMGISLKRGVRIVRFAEEDMVHREGDYYSITASQLLRYGPEIYGDGVKVEAFLFDRASFRFISETNKRVPVRPVNLLGFHSQYMQRSPLAVSPDSVTVYGPAEILARVNEIYTSTISLSDIRSNMHGEAKLDVPSGVRLSVDKVEYSLEVTRYVEMKTTLPITVRNVPAGVTLGVFPSVANVSFRCVFPLINDPTGVVGCYVDYEEFAGSINGRCVVRHDALPNGVISCTVSPEVVDCVERL